MKKNFLWIIGVFAFVVVGSMIEKQMATESAKNAYEKLLSINKDYPDLPIKKIAATGKPFTVGTPKFTVIIPDGFKIEQVLDQEYVAVYDITKQGTRSKFQVRVINTYDIAKDYSRTRDKYSFDVFMDDTMQEWFEGSIDGFLGSEGIKDIPKENIEKAIVKFNKHIAIFLSYDMKDSKTTINRKSINILKDGYDISLVSYIENEKYADVGDAFLRSIEY